MKVLIIEDEQITADDLASCIKEVRPNFSIVKQLPSVNAAITFLNKNPTIDLIFSDIQLTDGLSFEIFKAIEVNVPVIFCTAYDEYALNAFEANGIAYLLKPFSEETIGKVIEKYEKLTQFKNNKLSKLLQVMEQTSQPKPNASILVYQGEKIIPLPIKDIALLNHRAGKVELITFNKQYFTAIESLDYFDKLNLQYLFRANRQYLVNRKAIKNAEKYFNRKLVLNLNIPFEEQIIISKEKTPLFLSWLVKI